MGFGIQCPVLGCARAAGICSIFLAIVAAGPGLPQSSQGANLVWNAGTGNWDFTAGNLEWNNGTAAWTDGNVAEFAASGNGGVQTVTVDVTPTTTNVKPIEILLDANSGYFTFQHTGSQFIQITGAANNWVRSAGSFADFNGAIAKFDSAPSGSVSGTVPAQILIGATLSGSDFIKSATGNIAAVGYTSSTTAASSFTTGANMNVAASTTSNIGTVSINSLRFNASSNFNITITGSSATLTIASGMILFGSSATAGGTIGSAANYGKLTTGQGDLMLIANNATGSDTIYSQITGSIGLTKIGPGTVVLNSQAANTYTGSTTVLAGKLATTQANVLGDGTNANNLLIVSSAGTLDLSGTNQSVQNISGGGTIDNSSLTPATLTIQDNQSNVANIFSGVIQNSGSGALGLTFSGNSQSRSLQLSGANTYSGPTAITSNGKIIAGGDNRLSPNSQVNITSGTLDLHAFNESIGSLAGAGGTVTSSASGTCTLTLGADGAAATYSGTIAQGNATTFSLTKTGGGTQILEGGNSYNGLTSINGGTLETDTAGINGSSLTSGLAFGGGSLMAETSAGIATNKAITATATILLDTTNGPISLGGNIASTTGGLTLSGGNVLTLSGTNAYTGVTAINGGTLLTDTAGNQRIERDKRHRVWRWRAQGQFVRRNQYQQIDHRHGHHRLGYDERSDLAWRQYRQHHERPYAFRRQYAHAFGKQRLHRLDSRQQRHASRGRRQYAGVWFGDNREWRNARCLQLRQCGEGAHGRRRRNSESRLRSELNRQYPREHQCRDVRRHARDDRRALVGKLHAGELSVSHGILRFGNQRPQLYVKLWTDESRSAACGDDWYDHRHASIAVDRHRRFDGIHLHRPELRADGQFSPKLFHCCGCERHWNSSRPRRSCSQWDECAAIGAQLY